MRWADYSQYSLKKTSRLIRHAKKAPFWKSKLPSSIDSIDDFRSIPITTRKEINELHDSGSWEQLLTTPREKSHIVVTSGGRPYRSPFVSCLSRKEFGQMTLAVTTMFSSADIRRGSILITFPGVMPYPSRLSRRAWPTHDLEEYRSFHISGALIKQASIRLNLRTFCTGLRFLAYKISSREAAIEKDRIMSAYSMVKPDVLALSPNVIRNIFLPQLEKEGALFTDYGTKVLISGGSRLLEDDHRRIEQLGRPKVVLWIESGEIGTIGYSKPFKSFVLRHNFYYTTWRDNLFETVNRDGHALEFGRRGRIVVTRLNTFIQPLIRYDLEDEGQFAIRGDEIVLREDIEKI